MNDLFLLIKAGDVEAVRNLVSADPTLLEQQDHNGASVIAAALYYGKQEMASFLAENGAPINFQVACALGDQDLARRLLYEDPSLLNSFSPDGYPALGLAAFFGQIEVTRWLISLGADVNLSSGNTMRVAPLHAATACQSLAIARQLLEHGANVNQTQQDEYTPLHAAAANGQIEMVQLLLDFGANRYAHLTDGRTPADLASEIENASLKAMLA